jgi:hypothetical protein
MAYRVVNICLGPSVTGRRWHELSAYKQGTARRSVRSAAAFALLRGQRRRRPRVGGRGTLRPGIM